VFTGINRLDNSLDNYAFTVDDEKSKVSSAMTGNTSQNHTYGSEKEMGYLITDVLHVARI